DAWTGPQRTQGRQAWRLPFSAKGKDGCRVTGDVDGRRTTGDGRQGTEGQETGDGRWRTEMRSPRRILRRRSSAYRLPAPVPRRLSPVSLPPFIRPSVTRSTPPPRLPSPARRLSLPLPLRHR